MPGNLGRLIVSSALAMIASGLTLMALTPVAPRPVKAAACHACGSPDSAAMAFSPPCQWVCVSGTWDSSWANDEETISVEFKCGGLSGGSPCLGDYFALHLATTTFDIHCNVLETNTACNMIFVADMTCNATPTKIDCPISQAGMSLHSGTAAYVEIVSELDLGGDCDSDGLDGTLMCSDVKWFYWDGAGNMTVVNPPCN